MDCYVVHVVGVFHQGRERHVQEKGFGITMCRYANGCFKDGNFINYGAHMLVCGLHVMAHGEHQLCTYTALTKRTLCVCVGETRSLRIF